MWTVVALVIFGDSGSLCILCQGQTKESGVKFSNRQTPDVSRWTLGKASPLCKLDSGGIARLWGERCLSYLTISYCYYSCILLLRAVVTPYAFLL